jgi:hypothetical protein
MNDSPLYRMTHLRSRRRRRAMRSGRPTSAERSCRTISSNTGRMLVAARCTSAWRETCTHGRRLKVPAAPTRRELFALVRLDLAVVYQVRLVWALERRYSRQRGDRELDSLPTRTVGMCRPGAGSLTRRMLSRRRRTSRRVSRSLSLYKRGAVSGDARKDEHKSLGFADE